MYDHVTIRVADYDASVRFYETVLSAAGIDRASADASEPEWGDFSLIQATADQPPTRGLHVGFAVASREHVDRFWRAGVDGGNPDDGAPGERPQYTPDYYGGFLRDPDGNSAEAVHYDGVRTDGNVDHLWVRVADLAAAKRFYATIAPHAGIHHAGDEPGLAFFHRDAPGGGTFAVVADGGPVTERAHIAFPGTDAQVDAFHAAALAAGYRDNGGPGERSEYHPGYYAAFVLHPDGNNVEVVDHHH